MDAKTKQAWKYIKTLNYYSKEWKMPLEDLIYGFLDDMKEQELFEERKQFIYGIKELQFKKRLVGYIDIIQAPEEKIVLDNVKMNTFFRIWYWIPFKWGKGNREADIKCNVIEDILGNIDIRKCWQAVINGMAVAASFITVIQFARSLIH